MSNTISGPLVIPSVPNRQTLLPVVTIPQIANNMPTIVTLTNTPTNVISVPKQKQLIASQSVLRSDKRAQNINQTIDLIQENKLPFVNEVTLKTVFTENSELTNQTQNAFEMKKQMRSYSKLPAPQMSELIPMLNPNSSHRTYCRTAINNITGEKERLLSMKEGLPLLRKGLIESFLLLNHELCLGNFCYLIGVSLLNQVFHCFYSLFT